MPMVISKCRETGNHVFLAVEVKPQDLERSSGLLASAYCPFCDANHFWHARDTRLAGRSARKTASVRQAS